MDAAEIARITKLAAGAAENQTRRVEDITTRLNGFLCEDRWGQMLPIEPNTIISAIQRDPHRSNREIAALIRAY